MAIIARAPSLNAVIHCMTRAEAHTEHVHRRDSENRRKRRRPFG